MQTRHVASFNIGAIRFPLTDPRMAGFVSNLDGINALGDRSPGFVWRRPATDDAEFCARVLGNRCTLLNLTVWESVEDLYRFVWRTVHKQFYNRRDEWFVKAGKPNFVMWWIAPDHIPSIEEAVDKLLLLRTAGESDQCFGWRYAGHDGPWQPETASNDK